ncbi:hypothetical protein K437DRAFT_167853 [Tilletiaria anomala UBC 951]|uniref:Uncharacterized protein n=1 Tax=Tilletiaria anomala (strain ATCC 24038 / CBS 436.72 / UBC 951) TaxID=1037660 RepID=A0A066VTS2_TILAU|nr:uncharacterized protein K437DRAFT_167853 [Tilletiaria anomala UBC 951]KDN41955.1 hypothetical protein K437DRAFT_167853 [Tilletiaria anomala UBC 951]
MQCPVNSGRKYSIWGFQEAIRRMAPPRDAKMLASFILTLTCHRPNLPAPASPMRNPSDLSCTLRGPVRISRVQAHWTVVQSVRSDCVLRKPPAPQERLASADFGCCNYDSLLCYLHPAKGLKPRPAAWSAFLSRPRRGERAGDYLPKHKY